ncbi:MAG: thiol-disulfide isomerase/thioredoxin [Candidatus Azotimanducaceae bacterium]
MSVFVSNRLNNSAFLKLGLGLKVIFFVALLGLSGCAKEPSYRVADGSQMQLSELRGNWVLINYWADWCRPCREEIPELNILHQRQEGEPIFVLGVNFDYLEGQELTDLIGEMGIEFPVLVDDPQVLVGYAAAEVLPMTVIISPQGEVHKVLVGPQTAETIEASL